MIEFRQKDFGKKEIIEGVLKAKNWIRKIGTEAGKKRGSKQVASSLNKSHEARKKAEIAATYGNNPKLAQRKLEKLRASRKGRKDHLRRSARKKLDAIPDKVQTREQISEKARQIADQITPENIANAIKEAPKKTARSVMEGAKKTYENTGQIITEAGAKFREHPVAAPGWFSGDAVNIIGSATGHPEMLAVPVGSIAGAAGLAGESGLFPRKVRRKFRQNAIDYRKRRESGTARKGLQKLTPAHDWSLKKTIHKLKKKKTT